MESLSTFDRRECVYPLPTNGTPEEVVKAALKSWRTPERFGLTSAAESETGRQLPLRTVFALDVRRLAWRLPQPHRAIVMLYFMQPRPQYPRNHNETACGARCHEHYGNGEIAAELGWRDERGRPDSRRVGQLKRFAVSRIAVELFPRYYRGKKARSGV